MAYSTGNTVARVRLWDDDEGWGVVDALGLTGGCWVHFSAIDGTGHRSLVTGQTVNLQWESVDQDGFAFRAILVTP